jgi:hypothetical protein
MEERRDSSAPDIWPPWLVGFVMLLVRAAALDVLIEAPPTDIRLP